MRPPAEVTETAGTFAEQLALVVSATALNVLRIAHQTHLWRAEAAVKHRILVVEDHEDTRNILRALLTHRGFEMHEAESAEEMMERLEQIDPHLIVLDIRLPGMDGCEALRQLRSGGFRKPIFLFSEYFDLFASHIRSCAPDGFYPKSKGPVALTEGIEQRLSQSTTTS